MLDKLSQNISSILCVLIHFANLDCRLWIDLYDLFGLNCQFHTQIGLQGSAYHKGEGKIPILYLLTVQLSIAFVKEENVRAKRLLTFTALSISLFVRGVLTQMHVIASDIFDIAMNIIIFVVSFLRLYVQVVDVLSNHSHPLPSVSQLPSKLIYQ